MAKTLTLKRTERHLHVRVNDDMTFFLTMPCFSSDIHNHGQLILTIVPNISTHEFLVEERLKINVKWPLQNNEDYVWENNLKNR